MYQSQKIWYDYLLSLIEKYHNNIHYYFLTSSLEDKYLPDYLVQKLVTKYSLNYANIFEFSSFKPITLNVVILEIFLISR